MKKYLRLSKSPEIVSSARSKVSLTIFFMKKSGVIRYNRALTEYCLRHKQFDALILYYLLKITHSNSVIFKLEGYDLYYKLKADKMLPLNFSKERFKEALCFLAKHGFIYNDNQGHVIIAKITKNIQSIYYKSKIEYNRKNINFNIVKRLLLQQHLLFTKKKQEQAMTFRESVTTNKNKALGDIKCKRRASDESALASLGECYLKQVSFSYRKIAKVYGLSLSEVKSIIDWIKLNSKLKIEKFTECKHRVCSKEFFKQVKDKYYPKTYCYLTPSNNIVAVFGSIITT